MDSLISSQERPLVETLKQQLFDPALATRLIPNQQESNDSNTLNSLKTMNDLWNALNQFLTKSEIHPDLFYVRWLRATNGDVSKSMNSIIELIKWRERIQLEKLTYSHFDSIFTKVENFVYFMGHDKDGSPAICLEIDKFVPGSLPYDQLEKVVGFVLEIVIHELRLKSQGKLERFVVLIDYYNWGLSLVDTKLDKAILGTCQNYFPERLKLACLMRAPWLFSTAYAVVKVFLDEKTTEKIAFVSESEIPTELKKRFDEQVLLDRFGGKSQKKQTIKEYLGALLGPNETLEEYYAKRSPSLQH
ncbi:hypothetical protein C9374_001724 [Naegleria lovaniensis]|uniref:CRAL-TRIO domain-containing protein n=1 Tax=Naegleria lovaniensis TaxID=51637 RepID=A0AA88GUS4_NAELO|nr:uncharacterized protein C9374_001724 [Naegleria lovaniensis]KAG2387392.1 hypothetical protein C9374_001724 [Naegleria lovaniensis]